LINIIARPTDKGDSHVDRLLQEVAEEPLHAPVQVRPEALKPRRQVVNVGELLHQVTVRDAVRFTNDENV
jgi:hypothetical protein